MESFFVCNGNETQEIVKPTGAHDFCFQRFIGMVCTLSLIHIFLLLRTWKMLLCQIRPKECPDPSWCQSVSVNKLGYHSLLLCENILVLLGKMCIRDRCHRIVPFPVCDPRNPQKFFFPLTFLCFYITAARCV